MSTHSSPRSTQPPRLEVQIPTPITPQANIQQGPSFSFSPPLPSASQASIQQGPKYACPPPPFAPQPSNLFCHILYLFCIYSIFCFILCILYIFYYTLDSVYINLILSSFLKISNQCIFRNLESEDIFN